MVNQLFVLYSIDKQSAIVLNRFTSEVLMITVTPFNNCPNYYAIITSTVSDDKFVYYFGQTTPGILIDVNTSNGLDIGFICDNTDDTTSRLVINPNKKLTASDRTFSNLITDFLTKERTRDADEEILGTINLYDRITSI